MLSQSEKKLLIFISSAMKRLIVILIVIPQFCRWRNQSTVNKFNPDNRCFVFTAYFHFNKVVLTTPCIICTESYLVGSMRHATVKPLNPGSIQLFKHFDQSIRVLHKLPTIQECKYWQLCFTCRCTIRIKLQSWNIFLFLPLIFNFTFDKIMCCK